MAACPDWWASPAVRVRGGPRLQQQACVHPDGRVAAHHGTGDRAAPWLATAGAGDVLSGMITGLLARGIAPFEAAQYATWLHVEAARQFGPGLIAEDLVEEIPRVFKALDL